MAQFHLLRYGVFDSFDLAEKLLWSAVIEWKLSVEHCVEQHTEGPHVTWLAMVQLT